MLFVYRFKHNGEMEEGVCQNSDAQQINGDYLFSICFRFFKTFCLEINGSAARIYTGIKSIPRVSQNCLFLDCGYTC